MESNLFTTAVHALVQYPINGNDSCFGGIAILSVYSRPSSITPASICFSFVETKNLIPELSTKPIINYELVIFFSWETSIPYLIFFRDYYNVPPTLYMD